MTELYINNQLVDLPTDFKVTLVTENLYFSSASTYTFDVKLPMAPCSNNARIFANINRLDKSVTAQSLPARLIVDNRVILNGTAAIVGITDESVSVQLLQGRSEQNWKAKYEKTYIDELALGNVQQWHFDINSVTTSEGTRYWATINEDLAVHDTSPNPNTLYWEQDEFETANSGNVVLTPIINHETGELMNQVRPYRRVGSSLWWREWFNVGMRVADNPELTYPVHYAPQPKLKLMINKVFNALGLRITYNELENTDYFNSLFIANSTEVVNNIAELLPHWTFNEFVEQLQLIFNCTIVVADNNTRIYLRKNFYNQQSTTNTTELAKVVDEFNIDIDEPAVSDADKAKVFDIAFPDYGTMFLGPDFADVPIFTASQLGSIRNPNVFSRNAKGVKVSSPYKENGVVYGYEVDQYEASPATTDEQATLRFIPLMPDSDTEPERFFYYLNAQDDGHWGEYTLTIPESSGIDATNEYINIQEYLDSLEAPPTRNTLDKLTLGFLTRRWLQVPSGSGSLVLTHYDVMTVVYQAARTADYSSDNIPEQPYAMSLYPRLMNNGNVLKNLYETFYKNTPQVVVSSPVVVKFVTKKLHNPLDKFLIHNQLFACQQIKYTIDAKGFQPIAEGTFYKL